MKAGCGYDLPHSMNSPSRMIQVGKTDRVRARILKIMSDKNDWTIPELASTLGLSTSQVRSVVRALIDVHQIYHSNSIGLSNKNTYRIVLSDDIARNAKLVEVACVDKLKLDQCHREHEASWPVTDQALSDAIFAMIRSSRHSSRYN
ncbi:helix-turn-helix domain-containing protein [Burkholderia metallica]|uniref:hypothetical protein n=1 Tax=Burkholderia metallica TaxID=488729 RepID=UPI001CF0E2AB|nr:hypothetical protein [Burkholderia metallica]MCA8023595.1 hypothetical protein [Burkholderia metallica]